jgi:two-component system alkaline phosphatase synthesis response regulator PhoP
MSQKILVADDNQDTVLILSAILRKEGYAVITANDGLAAIQSASREMPALILLDVMMPQKDGFEVCTAIKENSRTKDIPIVMLTAKTDPFSRSRGLALGCCEFMTKPLNPRQVLQKVKENLPPDESSPPGKPAMIASLIGAAPLLWDSLRALWTSLVQASSSLVSDSPLSSKKSAVFRSAASIGRAGTGRSTIRFLAS